MPQTPTKSFQWVSHEDHNRTIRTGPTPDGAFEDLLITVNYRKDMQPVLYAAINVDNHIVPLILRTPAMRDLLRECLGLLTSPEGPASAFPSDLADRIKVAIAPTEWELHEQQTPSRRD